MVKWIAIIVMLLLVSMSDAGCLNLFKGRLAARRNGNGACGAQATAAVQRAVSRVRERTRGVFRANRSAMGACAAESIAPPQAPPVKK